MRLIRSWDFGRGAVSSSNLHQVACRSCGHCRHCCCAKPDGCCCQAAQQMPQEPAKMHSTSGLILGWALIKEAGALGKLGDVCGAAGRHITAGQGG